MKQETQQQTASTTTSQKVVSQQAQKSSASAIDKLKEFGGFAFLENIIDGYSNLNPARKARRNIFLTDEQWENERKASWRSTSTFTACCNSTEVVINIA